MKFNFENLDKPLFIQVAEQIEEGILKGIFLEDTQIPSSTEISVTFKINPATVIKGVRILIDKKIISKRRGIGMFVEKDAKTIIKTERTFSLATSFINPMLEETKNLDIKMDELIELIKKQHKYMEENND